MLKLIFLILSIFMVGCASGLPKPPIKQVRMLDADHRVCGLYDMRIRSSGKPEYTWVKDISLDECDGSVCLSPSDYKKSEVWAINAGKDYTCKLKE